MMTWTSTGLCIWPATCYIPKAKIMNFNNYNLQHNDSSIITDDGEIFYIIPENYADWKKLEGMSHTERILFIEYNLPKFIDEIVKDKCFIDKWLKEKEIKEAAALLMLDEGQKRQAVMMKEARIKEIEKAAERFEA